ncbi:MAG: flagellar basal body L-ring protein FlgH [Endozoicomonas sp.]|uniref:flagellar basal body L-ring protein FlgH n=1 Tax=Endozoicomonas sp. TaxID=1892382 RepID=UPI003D9B2629
MNRLAQTVSLSLWALGTLLLLQGCTGLPNKEQKYERIPPVKPAAVKPVAVVPVPIPELAPVAEGISGSLYRANYPVQIFSDRRAYRVGDILTINIAGDNFDIKKDSNTTLDKNGSIAFNDPTIFGKTGASILGSGRSLAFNASPTRQSYGNTNLKRASKLTEGQIAVQVVQVLPNGALRVQGEKWLQLNNEAEFVRVSGMLRPEDISTNNEVASTKLAQARITYSGVGSDADVHEPGWGTKIINSPWFPF